MAHSLRPPPDRGDRPAPMSWCASNSRSTEPSSAEVASHTSLVREFVRQTPMVCERPSKTQATGSRVKTVPCCRPALRRCRSPPVFAPQPVELNHAVRAGVEYGAGGGHEPKYASAGRRPLVKESQITRRGANALRRPRVRLRSRARAPSCGPASSYPERRIMGPCLRRLHL